MFTYTVSKIADNLAFKDACIKLESTVKNLKKVNFLIDVDGTLIQIYNLNNNEIKIINDYEVDAVYIDSDISLDSIFL